MKQKTIQEAFNILKTEEYQNFLKVMERLVPEGSGRIDFPDNGIFCATKMWPYTSSSEIKSGMVLSVTKMKTAMSCYYKAFYVDSKNNDAWWEDVKNMEVGNITRLTEHLERFAPTIDVMLANYLKLSDMEKLFLSEIVGDEEWVINHKYILPSFFNGKCAPNGDRWSDACFKKTQKVIRDKIAKGTEYEQVDLKA